MLTEFLEGLQTEFECNGSVLGPDNDEVQEIRFLGRIIRLTDYGLEWEGDPKHANRVLEKTGSFMRAEGEPKNFARTPGVNKENEAEEVPHAPPI